MKCHEGLNGLSEPDAAGGRTVVIGAFDGVHLGHRRLILTAREGAGEDGAELAVLTFWPPPQLVLSPGQWAGLLCSREHKTRLIGDLGVDSLVTLPFDRELAGMSPAEFARGILAGRLGASRVYVGYNFTFGRDSAGDAQSLRRYGERFGFAVHVLPPVCLRGETVSSTLIRETLREGRVCSAAALLGRPFSVEGRVVRGEGRGARQIGHPTANLRVSRLMALPRDGVYGVQTRLGGSGETHPGVANVGPRPTFGGGDDRSIVEVHVIGFDGDLYGQRVRVAFRRRLRDQRTFASAEALGRQIARDIEAVTRQSLHRAAGGS